jgi:hypothetical protein
MHGTIRAATLKTVVGFIMQHFSVSENEALKLFYESYTGERFSDNASGLYGQSAVYIFSLFLENYELSNKIGGTA